MFSYINSSDVLAIIEISFTFSLMDIHKCIVFLEFKIKGFKN